MDGELARSLKRGDDKNSALAARELLDELEQEIERLRISYEQYFVGVEKRAPLREDERLRKLVRRMERTRMGTTVLRFRYQGLRARLVTYQHYWTRVMHQIEAGIHRRDSMRRGAAASTEELNPGGESNGQDQASAISLPAGMTEDEVRQLHRDLVAAKEAAGESTKGLTFGALVKKLAREVPVLQQRHRCEGVRFEVATSSGKVHLRARPR